MSSHPQSELTRGSRTDAGAAGVGGGTLLVVLANSLPESSKIKPWLLLAAPSVSLGLSATWLWCRIRLSNYLRDREVAAVITKTRATLAAAIANPDVSDEHRADLRRQLEELDRVAVAREMEKVKLLPPIAPPDMAAARPRRSGRGA
jgi:hypothetical protein